MKTLFLLSLAWLAVGSSPTHAAEVSFNAQVDREQIALDESVQLKIVVSTEGAGGQKIEGQPQFSSPGFDVVNSYQSTFTSAYYENDEFGMRTQRQFIFALRPKQVGQHKLTDISVIVSGKTYRADPITVEVTASGAMGTPPKGYGSGTGLGAAAKRPKSSDFFVRAEVSKNKAYKGEQVIVSYYLYRKAQVFNIQVNQFPTLPGFLREDLEMPIVGTRLNWEQVVLDGEVFFKGLLARYAAYPLKTGHLQVDPLAIKANYFPAGGGPGGLVGEEDDFFGSVLRRMNPQEAVEKNDPVGVDVFELPAENKPLSFSGAVGDFSIQATVDKTQVKENEALNLVVTVEGRGNVSSIELPKVVWPEGVQLYDSKGRSKSGQAGVGQKVFDLILIPRKRGELVIPKLDLSYFDPSKKEYITRSTEPLSVQVLEGAPGSAPPAQISTTASRPDSEAPPPAAPPSASLDPAQWRAGGVSIVEGIWRGLGAMLPFMAALAALVLVLFAFRFWQNLKNARAPKVVATDWKSFWKDLARTHTSEVDSGEADRVVKAYDEILNGLYQVLDQKYEISARSFSREELGRRLGEEFGFLPDRFKELSRLMEYCENLRVALQVGLVSLADAQRGFKKALSDAEQMTHEILR